MFEGKGGIVSARVLADSVSSVCGTRLITFEICFPRIILAELNTHRMLPKNSASSRAIPLAKMEEQLTGRPVRFGQANPGMQDKGVDFDALVVDPQRKDYGPILTPEQAWEQARDDAREWSRVFYKAGYHKQVYNRLTEAYQMMKTVISGTEWNNFFWLRDDGAADPTIAELARVMREAKDASKPMELRPGFWHLPYVDWNVPVGSDTPYFKDEFGTYVRSDWETLRKISAARSAAVSFRNTDYNLAKCLEVFDRLVGDERKHASAFEHQATPMQEQLFGMNGMNNLMPSTWEAGVSHMDKDYNLWSGPFRSFIQFRKLIPGENVPG